MTLELTTEPLFAISVLCLNNYSGLFTIIAALAGLSFVIRLMSCIFRHD